ncbi:lipase [filamentous cyanobacterium CCP5]|nr:lipase [filamentous cyanobacterium CCP5]
MTEAGYFSGFQDLTSAERGRLMPEALPRLFKAKGDSRAVVICLHGFGGTPYEVVPVAKACAAAGVDVVTVVQPRHGYSRPPVQRREFAQLRADELRATARKVIAQARDRYDRVGIFGLSMGGAIALLMAAEQRVDACGVAAAALRLPAVAEILIPALSRAPFYLPVFNRYPVYLPSYGFYHSYALRALWEISQESRARLGEITCPVWAVHSQKDDTIPPVVMDWMQRDIKAPLETAWFNKSSHPMPLDIEGDAVSQYIAQGLTRAL